MVVPCQLVVPVWSPEGVSGAGDLGLTEYVRGVGGSFLHCKSPLGAPYKPFSRCGSLQKGELEESSRWYKCVVWRKSFRGQYINVLFRLYTDRRMIPLHQIGFMLTRK